MGVVATDEVEVPVWGRPQAARWGSREQGGVVMPTLGERWSWRGWRRAERVEGEADEFDDAMTALWHFLARGE
jgi:hypothetical protein